MDLKTGGATAWNPTSNGVCTALAVGWGNTYVAGTFSGIGFLSPRYGIAQLDTKFGAATSWNPNTTVGFSMFALGLGYGTAYLSGNFTTFAGQSRNGLVALDAFSGAVTNWNPDPEYGYVKCILATHGTIFLGGYFQSVLLAPHANLAGIYESPAGVGDLPGAAPGTMTVAPNPFRGDVTLRFALARPGPLHAAIYDPAGRLVRSLDDRLVTAGPHELRWDGRDAAGRAVRAGLYFARVDAGGEHLSARVLRMR